MADELLNYLMSDSGAPKVSPEMLEMMGKQASQMYQEGGTPLNSAVVKIASECPDINPEQVRRVCEFANQATYLSQHEKNKVAGNVSSYPQFDLADPEVVTGTMGMAARVILNPGVSTDYNAGPARIKESSASVESAFAAMFGAEDRPEDVDSTSEAAVTDVLETKSALTALKDHLSEVGEQFDLTQKTASAEYYDLVKRHLLDGGSFADVLSAAKSTGADSEKIASVMKPVIGGLLREKVASVRTLQEAASQTEKLAHRVVNPEHPMVHTFLEMLQTGAEIEKISSSLVEVDAGLDQANSFLREAMSGLLG